MTIKNVALATDTYKFSHFMQYPPGTEYVSSYIESRGSSVPGVDEVVFFGLQAFIRDVLMNRTTRDDVEKAKIFCEKHGVPFNYEGWLIIVNDHDGFIPVSIMAVPEGTPIPISNVMATVVNTDPRLPWVTSYIETLMLSYIWYGSTVATLSREVKKIVKTYLDKTCDSPDEELPWKLHDFGYRGVAAGAAGLGGAAHLVNFLGTDTVAGIEFAMEHYNTDVCGFSISASEHSTMTAWGFDGEFDAYANMVAKNAKKYSIFACVIDSYDTMNAIDLWCKPQNGKRKSLLDEVRDADARVVLRPDSGDPVMMPITVIEKLMNEVGYHVNSKGYKVLPSHVRVIQGDGIGYADIAEILKVLESKKISAENITFGMGGGLLQKVNRDTFKFAMKASAIRINGEWRDVFKNPNTDSTKKSKAGVQTLIRDDNGEYVTMRDDEVTQEQRNNEVMEFVFCDGLFYSTISFDEVRENAKV